MMNSLTEYILVDSEKIAVDCYRRGEGTMWLYYPYTVEDTITLSSIDFEFPLELLYKEVTLSSKNIKE